jgi:hypothetical protein
MSRILRITKTCPITGGTSTTIYRRRCFGWKPIIKYGLELTKFRTIGVREPHLGLPSVDREFGTSTWKYVFKRDL